MTHVGKEVRLFTAAGFGIDFFLLYHAVKLGYALRAGLHYLHSVAEPGDHGNDRRTSEIKEQQSCDGAQRHLQMGEESFGVHDIEPRVKHSDIDDLQHGQTYPSIERGKAHDHQKEPVTGRDRIVLPDVGGSCRYHAGGRHVCLRRAVQKGHKCKNSHHSGQDKHHLPQIIRHVAEKAEKRCEREEKEKNPEYEFFH